MMQERNLLTGLLAVQLKFATPQHLVAAAGVWALDQQRDIGTILVQQKVLTERQRKLLAELISEQAEAHQGDFGALMVSLGGDAAVQASFGNSLVFDRPSKSLSYAPLGGDTPEVETAGVAVPDDREHLTTEQPGRYTTRGEQGRGGIGRVLIAFDETIRREIALKELLPSTGGSGSGGGEHSPIRRSAAHTARFLREARITGQLEHPGIVPVYELGQRLDGSVYYTMKLVRGVTLADKLKASRSLTERLALLPHFLDLCQAIAYAHSRGVVHRDIKPANVMVGQFGETVLLDWGLAKVAGMADVEAEKLADEVRLLKEAGVGESVAGRPIGTPSYMSPEQADGRIEDVDERSDVWSLGAVLYEILTGQPPFTGSTAFEVIGMVLSDEVMPVLQRNEDAPPELAAVAMRCLWREPAQRYRSVEQLAADTTAFTSGGLVGAYKYSTATMLRRWAHKNWAVLATSGVALLILCIVAGYSYSKVVEQRNAALAANTMLDQSQRELLAFKLATESSKLYSHGHGEQASLLALEAAKYFRGSKAWMPAVSTALRDVAAAEPFSRDLVGHSGAIRRVVFSPDGHWLASCGDDRTVALWDMHEPAKAPIVLAEHELSLSSIDFSPDSRRLVSACHDMVLRVWDIEHPEKPVARFTGHEAPIWAVDWSADGRLLASAGVDMTVRVWQVDNPSAPPVVLTDPSGWIQSVRFSPNGRLLACCGDENNIYVWNALDLKQQPQVIRHNQQFTYMEFTPDSATLAVSCRDLTVKLFDTADLQKPPRQLQGHDEHVWSLALSADGSRLASGAGDLTIRIWDMADLSAPPQVISNLEEMPWSLSFSPDGNQLASSSVAKTVLIWDLQRKASSPRRLQGHSEMVRSLAQTSDGSTLVSGTRVGNIMVWDMASGATLPKAILSPYARPKQLHPDFAQVPFHAGTAEAPADNRRLVSSVDIAPGNRRLVSGHWDMSVRLWDLADLAAPPIILGRHEDRVRAVSFSPDGKSVATAGDDGTIRFWDPENPGASTGTLSWGEEVAILSLDFRADGRELAASGSDATVRIWSIPPSGGPQRVLRGHTAEILYVRYSPDGTRLATGSGDHSARLWDLSEPDGGPTALRGHTSDVYGVAWSPDGRQFISSGWDQTIRKWNLDLPGSEPELLSGHTGAVPVVLFSTDGSKVISGSADSEIRIWAANAMDLVEEVSKLPTRNLSLEEWQAFVGPEVEYGHTISSLPLGEGAHGVVPVKRD